MADKPRKRRSFTREYKLSILEWHRNNGNNMYKTCKQFDLNSKTVLQWVKNIEKIQNSPAHSMKSPKGKGQPRQTQKSDQKKRLRKSYTREYKLMVVEWYNDHNKNMYKTCKFFKLNSKTFLNWLRNVERITAAPAESRKVGSGRKAKYPNMEKELYRQFKEIAPNVAGRGGRDTAWFVKKAREIMQVQNPSQSFRFSGSWFQRFRKRYNLGLTRGDAKSEKKLESETMPHGKERLEGRKDAWNALEVKETEVSDGKEEDKSTDDRMEDKRINGDDEMQGKPKPEMERDEKEGTKKQRLEGNTVQLKLGEEVGLVTLVAKEQNAKEQTTKELRKDDENGQKEG